jgi:hypothetical protein
VDIQPEKYFASNVRQKAVLNRVLFDSGVKPCPKCQQFLPLSHFHDCITHWSGKGHSCKLCARKKWWKDVKKQEAPLRHKNPQTNNPNTKICRGCFLEKNKDCFYALKNSADGIGSHCKECTKKTNDATRGRRIIQARVLRQDPKRKQRQKELRKIWIKNNPDKWLAARRRNYHKYKNDSYRKVRKNLRGLFFSFALRCKYHSVFAYIGCGIEEFKSHISQQFINGMNWDNYGRKTWHLDHIVPEYLFNPFDDNEVKMCWNYRNFQPLDAMLNCGLKCDNLQIAKEHLMRKIEKYGTDEMYQKLLNFLNTKILSQGVGPLESSQLGSQHIEGPLSQDGPAPE